MMIGDIVRQAGRSVIALLILGVGLAVGGCAQSPTMLDLKVEAANNINPDPGGRAAPLVVTLYQLKSTAAFDAADYFQLVDKPANALGDSLVASEQVVVVPGQALSLPRQFDPGAQYVGIIAAFRSIDRAKWRVNAPVPAGKKTSLTALIDGLALALKPAGN